MAGSDASIELLSLFPRTLLKGQLEASLLNRLQDHCRQLLLHPERSPDASAKLAGQLAQQRELRLDLPVTAELCQTVLLPACERWIRHVIDREPPQGRGPWLPGRYGLQMIDLWLNVQRQGDYNPTHTHGGSFSGVIFLQVPPQISADRFDGQLCFHGPEEWHIQSFRTGMAHYVLPVPGDFYVFPAWQPHSVCPFRGEGERWSIAFNVVAVPQPLRPAPSTLVVGEHPVAGPPPGQNVSLSSSRRRPGGF
jgi:Putative 2OG-Fe(II) oxygenase